MTSSNPYVELVRTNVHFRRLWLGDMASLLGDWFNTIALYVLVRSLTGSPLALGLVFISKMLPFALASPLAGLIVDRCNRRMLMIVADLLRAVVVLGLLFVRDAGDIWLLYSLSSLQLIISAVFIPARSASLPNITSARELLVANTLSAATWSTLLAVGAAAGGLVTEWLGIRAVFLLDSLSYIVSAYFIFRTVIPQETEEAGPGTVRAVIRDTVAGWRHMLDHPRIGRMALAKAAWASGGGGLVYMLALLGEELRPAAPALGMGFLYAVRGLGTGIGPILARRWAPNEESWPTLLGLGIALAGVVYLVLAAVPWTWWILILVLLAHAPSGANWVFSTVLLQQRTVDRYRGRVFATEWLLLTLADSIAILASSALIETGLLSLRGGFFVFAGQQVVAGAVWLAWVVPAERRDAALLDSSGRATPPTRGTSR